MKLLEQHEWDAEVEPQHRAFLIRGWQAFNRGSYAEARDAFWQAYLTLYQFQPQGRRVHKGESLANYAVAQLWGGDREAALRETVAAFIEDAQSQGELSAKYRELSMTGAGNLLYAFGVRGFELLDAARAIRRRVSAGDFAGDPHDWLNEPWARALIETAATDRRELGRQRLPPEKRVFVGGWYGRLKEELWPLARFIDANGWEAVVVADLVTPTGWGQDEVAIAALRLCHRAVFDVSENSGAIEEIASIPDTMQTPERLLAVFDARAGAPGISKGMTIEKLSRWGVSPKSYSSLGQLEEVVMEWLDEHDEVD